jgi:hypothetical protein
VANVEPIEMPGGYHLGDAAWTPIGISYFYSYGPVPSFIEGGWEQGCFVPGSGWGCPHIR